MLDHSDRERLGVDRCKDRGPIQLLRESMTLRLMHGVKLRDTSLL